MIKIIFIIGSLMEFITYLTLMPAIYNVKIRKFVYKVTRSYKSGNIIGTNS